MITNAAVWSSPLSYALIKGDNRRFAEQSLELQPPAEAGETAQADKLMQSRQANMGLPDLHKRPLLAFGLFHAVLAIYVGLPALLAALLFRGGLVLLATGVGFVRRDGQRASRLRLLWRYLVAWLPFWPAFIATIGAEGTHRIWGGIVITAAVYALTAISVLLPKRGLPDRLAGTWPVPR